MFSALLRHSALLFLLMAGNFAVGAQQIAANAQTTGTPAARQQQRDRQFLLRRGIAPAPSAQPGALPEQSPPLERIAAARAQQATQAAAATRTMARSQAQNQAQPLASSMSQPMAQASASPAAQPFAPGTTWQAAGPVQLLTLAYGLVTGRVSSLAVDPNDTSGNTVYLGATGGGVWKSTNAAGSASGVTFTPLTDDLPTFANSSTSIPSLSIGALTVQPGNPNILLAGTGDTNDALDSYYGVGILRSTDAGSSWNLIGGSRDASNGGARNYSFAGNGFAGFAWSTTNANLVVAAVSQSVEGALVNTQPNSSVEAGLFYSTDAGRTWYLATITDGTNQVLQSPNYGYGPPGNAATSVVWNPKRNLFIAAVRYHGYYSSSDGITWTRLAQQPGAGLSSSVCPANSGGTGSQSCPIFRGVLAVQPVTGDTFALTTDQNNADQGLYRDVCSTSGQAVTSCPSSTLSFGVHINDTALDDPQNPGYIDQADYNLTLSAVSSQQDTILFAGTEDVYRCSLANSCTWRNTTNNQSCSAAQVAPSIHAIDGTFGANGPIYFGNDGGLWRSTDQVAQTGPVCAATDAAHFQNLNGGIGSLAEISHLAVSPASSALVLAGMGEFGIVASPSTQSNTGAWQQLLTGEGSYVAIDPTNPSNWFADGGGGVAIFSCANGGNCNASGFGTSPVIGRTQVQGDADYFLGPAPWILDPLNPQNIILGTCRMWLGPATGGNTWSSANLLSGMLDGNQGSFCNGNAELRSVGAGGSYNSAQGGEQMYAGMAGPLDGGGAVPGHIYSATVPQGGGKVAWTDLWRNPVANTSMNSQFNGGGYAISSITVDPHDASGQTVYVAISGFGQTGILYSTADGGAHWANITNSLPFAPVSSVVVDPNNSSYVYVGGDFGVYYASNISTCSGTGQAYQNCWSQLGASLPNAPVTDLKVYSEGSSTVLEAATYGRGIWTFGLSTTPVTAQATLSPASASFGSQAVGSPSSTVNSFTLSSTGSIPLNIGQIAVSGDYAQTNNCGTSVAAGSSCTIQVTFTPTAVGDRPGTLTVHVNTASGVLTATLDGTGLQPGAIMVSPATLNFATTATGASSSPMSVTVKNSGGAPVQLGADSIAGANINDFSLGSGNGVCSSGSMLAAGATCTVPVIFNPVQTGTRTAQLQVTASGASGAATGSPATVNLIGNAVAPAFLTLTPPSLTFPATPQSSVSQPQSITVTNTGGVIAQLGTGAVSGDYLIVSAANACGATLAPNANCSVSIEFAPTAPGSRPGLFTLPSSSMPAKQVTASLNGNGGLPPLSPNPLAFNTPQQQGTASAAQNITVKNYGTDAAQLGSPAVSGDFQVASDNCPASLGSGLSCAIGITFNPTATGTRNGVLTLLFNGASVSDALSGTGIAGTLVFGPAPVFPATAQNTTAPTQSVSVTNTGNSPAQITSTVVAGPFAVVGNSCPAAPQTLAVHDSCTLGISFTPPGAASYTGVVTLNGDFSNTPASIPLRGQGATPPAATLTPSPLTFHDTAQGSLSSAQNLTITSTGGLPVTFNPFSISSDYQIASDACTGSLAPGNSCVVAIQFHPSATGSRPGTFSQPGNMTGSPLTASLNGVGLPPGAITLSPSSLLFNPQLIGTASAGQNVTITNTSASPMPIGTPNINSGDYLLGGSCPATLDAGAHCTLSISFDPTISGDRRGQLTLSGNAAVTALDGTGLAPGKLVANSLAFGNVGIGSTANGTATVTNSGDVAVHLGAITVGSGDFSIGPGGTCSASSVIPPDNGGSCTVAVTFAPSAAGSRSGALTLANDGSINPLQVGLVGFGVAAGSVSLSPASLSFGAVLLNTTATAQTITAKNSGGVDVNLGLASVTGNGYSISNNRCGSTLGSGASCTVQVTFTPTAVGDSLGTFSLPGQYSGSTATVSLGGSGVTPGALSLTPSKVVFDPVVVQSTETKTVMLQNTGGQTVTLGLLKVSNNFGVTSQCPGTLAPGASCPLQVIFAPMATGPYNGLLTVPALGGGSAASVALSGTGVLPGTLAVSHPSLGYPATVVGSSSAMQQVTFTNTGGATVPIAAPQVSSADYFIMNNGCGSGLPPGQGCSVQVAFNPKAAGDRSGTLTLASSASNGPSAKVALDGTGLAPASLAFSPLSWNFGSEADNTTSTPQVLTLLNNGGVATSLGIPTLSGEYKITANNCATTTPLAANSSCKIAVQFVPTGSGSQPGSLSIASTTGTPSATASLSGNALALVLSPASLTFTPALAIGTTSARSAPGISVANVGTTAITLQPPSITGDFAIAASSCVSPLKPNSSCTVFLTFTPTVGGLRTGVFTVSDGAETQATLLSGTGLSPAIDTLNPNSLIFDTTQVGSISKSKNITMTNSGDAALALITAKATGSFIVTNNCGASLGGHLSCSVAVSFAPNAVGAATGVLTITDAQRTQTVALAGNGAAPPQAFASPSSINFGPYAQGIATLPQIVTISNQGSAPMTGITSATTGPDFAVSSSTCGATLSPAATCQVGVVFTPGVIGNREGTLTVASSTLTAPLVISLAGSGEDFQLSIIGPATSVVTAGQPATYHLSVTPVGASAGSLAISCAGAPANTTCIANPSTVTLSGGATGSILLSIATSAPTAAPATTASAQRSSHWWSGATALALLCPLFLLRGEHRRRFLLVVAAIALLGAPIACGVHASGINGSAASAAGQTASGSYNITVNAAFPGAQRTTVVTLVVQ